MAKTVVINPADNTRVPFLRGILTRSLQNVGVPFEDAYQVASDVRRGLDDIDEISTSDLRTTIVRHLRDSPYQDAAERYQTNIRVPAPIMVRGTSGDSVPFSRSRMQQRLESCCLSTEDASDITRVIYDRLLQEEKVDILSRRLAALTYECIQQDFGADCAHRYLVWAEFSQSGRPLLLLIGGTAASGKSTISTEMASRLEIVRTQSTDMLRQVMRIMIPERLLPVLHTSSFNAWKTLSEDRRDRAIRDTLVVDGYLQQAKLIEVACEAVIERAIQERASLVLEGVHVLPSLREKIPEDTDAVVVPIMLGVLKRKHLMRHIKGRGTSTPQRRSERYMENFEDIWRLQTFILSEADRAGTPIVVNSDKEASIRELMRIIGDSLAQGFDRSPGDVFSQLCDRGEHTALAEVSKRPARRDRVKTKQS
ncbi:MAG: hypothetical protein OEU36_13515 [Gammaproteobacteria bacterium]|nr:hypothetical protein [Gammaproteobacteria bacterium]